MKPATKRIWISFVSLFLLIVASGLWLVMQVRQAANDHALILAIKRQDTDAAIRLLNQGANPNTQDRPWKPVTFQSLLAEMMARFRGVKPVKDTSIYSSAIALWYTTQRNPNASNMRAAPESVPLIRALLDHGADANGTDWEGMSVLHHAVLSDHFQTITLLLERHANPNVPYSELLLRPLWYANPKGAELLIAHGADVNLGDANGETPLWSTPLYERYGVGKAKVLFAHGADVNAVDKSGETPMMLVAYWHNVELMQLFYDHGAQVNARDQKGWTPLIWVFYSPTAEDHRREVRWLLEHGAKVGIKDIEGRTALDYADNTLPIYKSAIVRLLKEQQYKEKQAR